MNKNLQKNILYYFLYVLIYYISYTISVSFVAFVYFILDHGLSDIDSWLSLNSWELIIVSKLISLICTIKLLSFNSRIEISFKSFVKKHFKWPSYQIWVSCIFMTVTFYALLMQFSGGLFEKNQLSDFTMQSAIGSFLFYFLDFFLIIYLISFFPLTRKKHRLIFILIFLVLFILMTKFTLVYLGKFIFFVVLNLIFMSMIVFKSTNSLMNMGIYALTVISPLASLYGLDLIWDDKHALYSYEDKLPYFGIIGTWAIAYLYYFRKV